MPFFLSREDEAMVRFISRVTVCSEAQKEFTRESFGPAFARYFARGAFSGARRSRLAELMKNDAVCNAMKTINGALHDFELKFACPFTNFHVRPFVFWRNLISALLVLAAFVWLSAERGFDLRMLVGIVPAGILLWYAVRYDWL